MWGEFFKVDNLDLGFEECDIGGVDKVCDVFIWIGCWMRFEWHLKVEFVELIYEVIEIKVENLLEI